MTAATGPDPGLVLAVLAGVAVLVGVLLLTVRLADERAHRGGRAWQDEPPDDEEQRP